MTEAEAREWTLTHFPVSRETLLARYADILTDHASRQNLIAPSTLASIWSRHIVDSAQLVRLAGGGNWIDIGAGAGLPGIVAAILRDDPVLLVEPRRKRVEFLQYCVESLGLTNVTVEMARIAQVAVAAAIISARAVGSIDRLFTEAGQCAGPATQWLLPRGKSGREELAVARKTWQGSFHVEQSLTHPQSVIVVASGVSRR